MLVDLVLVERVDLCRLDRSPRGADLVGDLFQPRKGPTRQVDRRTLASEGVRDGPTDDPATPVDHGVLVLEQHVRLPVGRVNVVR